MLCINGNVGYVPPNSPNHTFLAAGHLAVYAVIKKRCKNDSEQQAAGSIRPFIFFQERYTKSQIEKNFTIFMAHFAGNNVYFSYKTARCGYTCNSGYRGNNTPLL